MQGRAWQPNRLGGQPRLPAHPGHSACACRAQGLCSTQGEPQSSQEGSALLRHVRRLLQGPLVQVRETEPNITDTNCSNSVNRRRQKNVLQIKKSVLLLRSNLKTGNLPEDDDHKAD